MYACCTSTVSAVSTFVPVVTTKENKWNSLFREFGWKMVSERTLGSARLLMVQKPDGSMKEYSEVGLKKALVNLANRQVAQVTKAHNFGEPEKVTKATPTKNEGGYTQRDLLSYMAGVEKNGCNPTILHRELGNIQAVARKTGDQGLYNLVYQFRGLFFRASRLSAEDTVLAGGFAMEFRAGTLNAALTLAIRRASGK